MKTDLCSRASFPSLSHRWLRFNFDATSWDKSSHSTILNAIWSTLDLFHYLEFRDGSENIGSTGALSPHKAAVYIYMLSITPWMKAPTYEADNRQAERHSLF